MGKYWESGEEDRKTDALIHKNVVLAVKDFIKNGDIMFPVDDSEIDNIYFFSAESGELFIYKKASFRKLMRDFVESYGREEESVALMANHLVKVATEMRRKWALIEKKRNEKKPEAGTPHKKYKDMIWTGSYYAEKENL